MPTEALLRKLNNNGYYEHYCPGCKELHMVGPSWHFNGDVDVPTFSPSFKVTGNRVTKDESGKWTGGWERDPAGNLIPYVCHYFITAGKIAFCSDSTHELAGQTLPLLSLPEHCQ